MKEKRTRLVTEQAHLALHNGKIDSINTIQQYVTKLTNLTIMYRHEKPNARIFHPILVTTPDT